MVKKKFSKINTKNKVFNRVENPQIFFETIRVENKRPYHLSYHNARMNNTRKVIFQVADPIFLENEMHLPDDLNNGIIRCRVIYSDQIIRTEFEPYKKRDIRTLQLVDGSAIHYPFKSMNRSALNTLFENRNQGDEVLIIQNNRVTDTSYANVAFWDGQVWLTPDCPLLEGTTRARLLDEGKITPADIKVENLWAYKQIWLFNAMMQTTLPVNKITIRKE